MIGLEDERRDATRICRRSRGLRTSSSVRVLFLCVTSLLRDLADRQLRAHLVPAMMNLLLGAKMKAGDHIASARSVYTHHGIYLGANEVVHYSGWADGLCSGGEIEITSIDRFASGGSIRVVEHSVRKYDANETICRAYSRLGEDWYSVLLNNCEHFANWCIDGQHNSEQVNRLIEACSVAAGVAARKRELQSAIAVSELLARISATEAAGSAVRLATSAAASGALPSSAVLAPTALGSSVVVATAATTPTAAAVAVGLSAVPLLPIAAAVGAVVGTAYVAKSLYDWWSDL